MQTVRTIYAAHLSTCKALNRPFTVLPNSTLNQKFNLFKDELPMVNEYPHVAYVGIGNKGASYEVTTSNYVLTSPVPKLPRFSALFNQIPFVVRPLNDDLPAEERIKYRLRVPVTIDGVDHVAYYLRALDLSNVIPTVELRNVTDGTVTTSAFTPTASDLAPSHPNLSTVNINDVSGDYLISTAKVDLVLGLSDIANIREACTLLYGDPRYAVINEVALCSGIDRVLQGTFGSVTSSYLESVATQINSFIYQYHPLTETTTEVSIKFDIGSSESLLLVTDL